MRATTARGVKSFGLLAREATGNQGKGVKPGNTQGHEGAGLEKGQNKISQASEGCETEGEKNTRKRDNADNVSRK